MKNAWLIGMAALAALSGTAIGAVSCRLTPTAAAAGSTTGAGGAGGSGGATSSPTTSGTTGTGTGGSGGAGGASMTGTGGATAGDGGAGGGSTGGGAPSGPTINGCNAANATDDTHVAIVTVSFGGSAGLMYLPNCIVVTAGTKVTFNGFFSEQPLVAGVITNGTAVPDAPGTTPLPTAPGGFATGASATFTMQPAGFYGYYSAVDGVSLGMEGAIIVQ